MSLIDVDADISASQGESESITGESDLLMELFLASRGRDVAKTDALGKQWVNESETQPQRLRREAIRLRFLIEAGEATRIHELVSLADSNPAEASILSTLAEALVGLGEPDRAIDELKARSVNIPDAEVSSIYVLEAELLRKQGRSDESVSVAERAVGTANPGPTKAEALRALGMALYALGRKEAALGAMEEAAKHDPTQVGLRWELAWKYAELNYHELSVAHYDILVGINPKNSAYLNNLAVELQRLGLQIPSYELYREAVDNGSALAASNISQLLLNVGAAREADVWLARGRECSEPDQRLEEAAARRVRDESLQNERRGEARTRAAALRRAMAAMSPSVQDDGLPTGPWSFEDGTIVEFVLDDPGAVGTGKHQGSTLRIVAKPASDGLLRLSWKVGQYGSTYSGFGRKVGEELVIVLENYPSAPTMQAIYASPGITPESD